ncbi:MAG: DUF3367 domain-containing protein, partial [Acidimicrobiia bacterium]|nr:DUF3367 domain-containing protein [Acidimicrobiia bacterium]
MTTTRVRWSGARAPVAGRGSAARPSPPPGADRAATALRHLFLALVAYVPLLLTAPGRVAADTKSYLYLDPGRLLERAPSMWDMNVGLGTVTHQNIGYLFPMGPWFWAFERLGAPDWVAQRLWVGTFIFAAGAGLLFLVRSLDWRRDAPGRGGWPARLAGGGALASAVVYMLSPYLLHYSARTSVILLPWAGLPWLLGLTQRALRSGSWRHPALFAVVVALVGGVNATALLLVGLGPLLWVPFSVFVHREVPVGRALATAGRIGVLTLGTSLWWISGLAVQGSYGIDVLAYTETVRTVATTSLSSEVLRGLGYWFLYGGDKVGRWIEPALGYVSSPWLVAVSFVAPALAIAAAFLIRWRYRAYFVALAVIGTAAAVGAYPYASPSPLGWQFKAIATSSSAGLAMRSTPRAVPLVALGLALLVGAGVAALARSRPRLVSSATALVAIVAALGLPPLWTGDLIGDNLQRPEEVPEYWEQATAFLDERGDATRVLEVPGSDFASYRWGTTLDPITPGLMDRPYVDRELIPYGSDPSADLVIALDRQFQERLLDTSVIAPLARLLGAGDVLLRSDLQYERYRTPRPRALWSQFEPAPQGLGPAVEFGERSPNLAIERLRGRDETDLAVPEQTGDPPPVAVFPVEDPRPIVRASSADRPLLLAGSGEGVVEAAAAGLLDGEAAIFYSAGMADDPTLRQRVLDAGAELVLTDSNRRRGRRWSTVWENTGYTERAGEEPLVEDPTDNRLPLFPDAGDDAFTTVEQRGVRRVEATSYGNPNTFVPETRAANALDGDVETAWRTGDFSPVTGERLVVELEEPVTTDTIEVVQPITGNRNRFITEVEVRLDGDDIGTFDLDGRSRRARGQRLELGPRTFSTMELVVAGDNVGRRKRYDGQSPVGFAEVRIADVRVDEVVRLPSDLMDAAGDGSADHDLTVLLDRARQDPIDPGRTDEEQSMVRAFELPTTRRFTLAGDARISPEVAEPEVDRLLGIPTAEEGGVTARSSSHLEGILSSRASSALDGDEDTVWRTRFGAPYQEGAWIDVRVPRPVTVDHLDLRLVADGEHSVPTRLRIRGGGETRTVRVPAVADRPQRGAIAEVSVPLDDPLTARRLQIVVEEVRPVESIEYYSEAPIVRPIGVAELGIPGVERRPAPAQLSGDCRDDLLEVDGDPVGLRVTGTTEGAEARASLAVEPCEQGARQLGLGEGDHLLRATPGKRSGLDLDRLVLRSAARGGTGRAVTEAPQVEVIDGGRTSFDLQVRGATEPFWLTLGQSHNLGWGGGVDGGGALGQPTVIDGYANGWYIDPGRRDELTVHLEWGPQK